MKKIKNSQSQTKFTGSYKKKSVVSNLRLLFCRDLKKVYGYNFIFLHQLSVKAIKLFVVALILNLTNTMQ